VSNTLSSDEDHTRAVKLQERKGEYAPRVTTSTIRYLWHNFNRPSSVRFPRNSSIYFFNRLCSL